MQVHRCLGDVPSQEPCYWLYDGRGIPLCKACDKCRDIKLSKYRVEILTHYNENDVDEAIESEEW